MAARGCVCLVSHGYYVRSRWALLLVFAAAAMKPAAAQPRSDQDQRGRIRSEVSLVSLLSSVLDKDGRPALDLTAGPV